MFTPRARTTQSRRSPSARKRSGSAFAARLPAPPSSIPRATWSSAFDKHPMDEERFLILRMGALGDIIHTLPAVAALRETFPRAEIHWLADRKWLPMPVSPGFRRRRNVRSGD